MASNDPSPHDDPFGPPVISTLVHCIHCGEEYDSYRIEWRVETRADGGREGYWCCPMPGCGGMGFGFDIFPVDPEYRDENGELMWTSDVSEDYDDESDEACDELDSDEWLSDLPEIEARSEAHDAEAEPEDELPW